jgi:exodeoxyribonuclease VII small subunit
MANNKQNKDISKPASPNRGELTFEQAIKQLTDIVGKIELGEIPLQQSLEQYEKGMELIKHCRDILKKAEERIEKITKEDDRRQKADDR